MSRRAFCLILTILLLLTSGCGYPDESGQAEVHEDNAGSAAEEEANEISFFAMDTYMTIRAWGVDDDDLAAAQELVDDLESRFSTTDDSSEIAILNASGCNELSAETLGLLNRALELCELCQGYLDITIYPVVKAWGFTTGDYRVPAAAELTELLKLVDWRQVSLSDHLVSLPEGVQVDLGSIAKGYAGDRIIELLRSSGAEHALLDLGGNIQTLGTKPDGSDWRIAVKDPEKDSIVGVLAVSNRAVITSGGYERYFIADDGELYWHIMDPASGYPARNGLISVSVVGDEGAYCDALSTALFVMGEEKAIDFWLQRGDFDMVLIREDGTILITPDLAESFTLDSGSARPLQVIGDVEN